MENVTQLITSRRSVRTFDGKSLTQDHLKALRDFFPTAGNPWGIPVEFRLLDAGTHGLVCPVASGVDLFVGGKLQKGPDANVAFGYSFELLVLYAESLGIGTVWLGGTMNRPAFEKAMDLAPGEIMPCASPLGYPAEKMSIKETLMRKAIQADTRLPFGSLFFDKFFGTPLAKEQAGLFAHPLEMVRLAPSAVNKQPWRVVVDRNAAHFYLRRSKGFSAGALDMQKIDLGIALCHFALSAENATFSVQDPGLETIDEYIATYTL